MGSELESGLLLEGERGARGGNGDSAIFRGAGVDGSSVAPSRLDSSPTRVEPASGSSAPPHEEQNLPPAETCAPHFVQNFGGVVAHGDDGVGAVLGSMLQQQLESLLACLLAQIRKNGDVSTDDSLKRRAKIPNHASRADDDSAHDAEIPDDAVSGQFHRRSYHSCIHSWHFCSPWTDVYRCDSNRSNAALRANFLCYARTKWRRYSISWRACRSCLGRT